jgi:hypothetical protein
VNEPIELNFRYTQRDYVRAVRQDYASRLNLPLDCAAIALLIGVSVFFWRSPDMRWLAIASAVTSAGFALLLVLAFMVIPVLAFRREPKFLDEYSLVFSHDGVHFRTHHVDSRLEWGIYSRAVIDAHSYVLYYGTRHFTVVPRRVFSGEHQRLAFEDLLTQHVSNIIRRDA